MSCTGFLWEKTSAGARVFEKLVAKIWEKRVELYFNLLKKECLSSG